MLGHLSARGRLHLREKCTTNHGKLTICAFIHACMHAGLLGTPFRSGCGRQSKVTSRKLSACIRHACMHAYIMHAHHTCVRHTQYYDDAGNRLRPIITKPRNNYDTCDARQPSKAGYVKQLEVTLYSFSTIPGGPPPGPPVT